MAKYLLHNTLLFVLITAFLTMQSAAAHIHLAEHHDHDGSHHQHQREALAHQSIDDHDDVIDFSHQMDHANIVELDHEYNTVKENKQKESCATISTLAFQQPSFFKSISIEIPIVVNTKLSHLYRSSIKLRAPPQFS